MTDAEMIAEMHDRIGSEFDGELHLCRAEAERLLALAKEAQAARAEAERLREECAFLHRRRGELVLDRDRALTRVYDILAGINDHVEVGEDGYARLGSLNDRDQLQALCDELGARAIQEQRDD